MADNLLLLKRLQEGEKEALDELVADNMALVRHLAKRFIGRGVEFEDLVQIGSLGLIKAARAFSFDYGCLFSTYAVPLIIGEIKRFLRDDGSVKVSRQIKSRAMKLQRARDTALQMRSEEPTLAMLAASCDMTLEEAAEALSAMMPTASLTAKEDDNAAPLDYYLASDDPSEGLLEHLALKEALAMLTPLQQKLIYLRYQKDLSQSDVGRILGLTQVKVSREEKRILSLLKKALKEPN